MTASTEPSPVWTRTSTTLRSLSAMPLIQSGLSLVVSSLVSSGLGFVFWIVAANQYSSANLGVSSTVIMSMVLLADISHLGLRTGLVRFIPTAGRDARQLIVRSYQVAMVVAGLGAVFFVTGVTWWLPELSVLRHSLFFGALFVVATVFWVVFQLEDSALLGLRLAHWVPIENAAFGLAKILLLFPLARLSGQGAQMGAFLAWCVPLFVVVAVANAAMARALERQQQEQSRSGHVGMREVLSYSLIDWGASVGRSVVIGVMALLVLSYEGSSQSAYYVIAWTISASVHNLSANISDALLAEASQEGADIDRQTLHSGLLAMAISAPVVLVATVAATWILGAFGTEYAQGGTRVLQLLLLASIPNVVTRTYVGRLRAEGRMKTVFAYEMALSAGVLVVGWFLLDLLGIVGLGMAWLLALSVAALYVISMESRAYWVPKIDDSWLEPIRAVHRVVAPLGRSVARPEIDRAVNHALADRYQARPPWRRLELTDHNQTVLVSGHQGRPPLRIEMARTQWGAEILSRRAAALSSLNGLTGVSALRALVPYPIEHQPAAAQPYLMTSAVSGRPGAAIGRDGPIQPLVTAIQVAIAELHEASAGWMAFDQPHFDRWVTQPLRYVADLGGADPGEIVGLGRQFRQALDGVLMPSARLHGNLGLDKALFDGRGRLTGLIDWEWSAEGPAFLDSGSLALSTRAVESGQDIGDVVRRLLEDPEVFVTHQAMKHRPLPDVDRQVLVLFCWLHRVVPVLRATSPDMNRPWLARNVAAVLTRRRELAAVWP
jgi:O-antigen/teichoic acid export membrane protein